MDRIHRTELVSADKHTTIRSIENDEIRLPFRSSLSHFEDAMCRHNDRDDVSDAPLSKERDMPAILLCRLMKMPDVFARSCSDCPLLLRFDAPDKVKGERIDSCAKRITLMDKGAFRRMRCLNVHVEWRGRDPCHDAANFLLGRRSWGDYQFLDKAISGVFIGALGHSGAFFLRDARNGIGARPLLSSFTVDRFTLHAEHHTVNLVSIRQECTHPSTLRAETLIVGGGLAQMDDGVGADAERPNH